MHVSAAGVPRQADEQGGVAAVVVVLRIQQVGDGFANLVVVDLVVGGGHRNGRSAEADAKNRRSGEEGRRSTAARGASRHSGGGAHGVQADGCAQGNTRRD